MALPGDRAGLTTFDSGARVNQALTSSRAAMEIALSGVQAGTGTRIDLGIETGLGELLGPRHVPQNSPVMIVLTDGLPTGGTEGAAVRNAMFAQQLGVALFGIGLGRDADPILMLQITGDPAHYFFAPDTTTLSAIYQSIAGQILCQ
jgi:uncharacterized protein YegL